VKTCPVSNYISAVLKYLDSSSNDLSEEFKKWCCAALIKNILDDGMMGNCVHAMNFIEPLCKIAHDGNMKQGKMASENHFLEELSMPFR
jgi:hypothetical protein